MATEVQSGDLNSANSSRLEVSIDGLTLSPYSEGEQELAEMPAGLSAEESPGNTELSGDGEEDDPNSSATIEMKWGFYLVELYGLALRFFKGILYHYTHIQTLTEHKHALALSSLLQIDLAVLFRFSEVVVFLLESCLFHFSVFGETFCLYGSCSSLQSQCSGLRIP